MFTSSWNIKVRVYVNEKFEGLLPLPIVKQWLAYADTHNTYITRKNKIRKCNKRMIESRIVTETLVFFKVSDRALVLMGWDSDYNLVSKFRKVLN